jgi:hypothetical protein
MLYKTLAKQLNQSYSPKHDELLCSYYDGVYNYFKINSKAFKSKLEEGKWNGPCVR